MKKKVIFSFLMMWASCITTHAAKRQRMDTDKELNTGSHDEPARESFKKRGQKERSKTQKEIEKNQQKVSHSIAVQNLDDHQNTLNLYLQKGIVQSKPLLKKGLLLNIEEFDTGGHEIGERELKILAKALYDAPKIKRLTLQGKKGKIKLNDWPKREYKGMGERELNALGNVLQNVPFLEELDLRNNGMGERGLNALGNALQHVEFLEELGLEGNEIETEASVRALGNALQYVPFLERLDLRNNGMGERELNALGDALQRVPGLKELGLEGNEIETEASVRALGDALQRMPGLKALYIKGNKIGEDRLRQLALRLGEDNDFLPDLEVLSLSELNQDFVLDFEDLSLLPGSTLTDKKKSDIKTMFKTFRKNLSVEFTL